MSTGIYKESEQSFVNGIGRITWQQPWFLCLNCWGTHQNVQGCATKEYKVYFWINSWEHFQDHEHLNGPDLNFVPDIGWDSRSSSFGEWFHSQPGLQLPDNRWTNLDELARNNDWFHFFLLGGDSHSFYYYQGCYIDTGSRILSHQILTDSESQGNMTNSACINGCMEHGMQLYHRFPMWIK